MNLLSSSDKETSTGVDPHIWLDPILAEHQVNMIRDGLIKVDPNNANYYKRQCSKVIAQLNSLDSLLNLGCLGVIKILFHFITPLVILHNDMA